MPDLTELQDAIRQQQRRRRLAPALDRSVLKLPSPPILLLEMLRTIKDENSSARDLEHFFSIDLSLAAKLLRLANSSFFGLRYKVKTIREAVAVLGFRTLRSLAMAAFADNLFSSQLRVYGYSRNGLWKHSFGCAVMAREVARRLHYPPQAVEELFVAGMLHDIGKVVLGRFLAASPEWPGACSDPGGKPAVIAGERRIVGFDHAEIGRNIAEKWNLPPGLRNLILSIISRRPRRSGRTPPASSTWPTTCAPASTWGCRPRPSCRCISSRAPCATCASKPARSRSCARW